MPNVAARRRSVEWRALGRAACAARAETRNGHTVQQGRRPSNGVARMAISICSYE